MKPDTLIKVLLITDAHGIKGELKARLFAESPEFLAAGTILTDSSGNKKFTIKITGSLKNAVIIKMDGITDRNAAELLKNTELFIPASSLPAPEEGEYYQSQLIGLEIRNEDGAKLGNLAAIHNFGAGDIMEINLSAGGSEMIPFEEPWVSEINEKAGYITVTPAEYL